MEDLSIKILETPEELDEVYRLTYESYLREGYCSIQPNERLSHYPHLDNIPNTLTFLAVKNNQIIGTNSLTIDGLMGLPVDLNIGYKDKMVEIRQQCKDNQLNLGCTWRMVVVPHSPLNTILKLINITVEHVFYNKLHYVLYDVNPKHIKPYHTLLGSEIITEGHCYSPSLNGPPSTLMMSKYEDVYRCWIRVCEKRGLVCKAGEKL